MATSALLPKNVLIADSVVQRRRRDTGFPGKIDKSGAAVSTLSTMRSGRDSGNAFNVTFV